MTDSRTAADYPVYLGVWTNWSIGGRISGSTITLTHRNGALLTAFLAVFVTFIGSQLWRIACFALHQLLLSEPVPQDGLYHQRQTILRNASDEKSALISFSRILWAWRSKASRPFSRILPMIAFSAFLTAGFALGSIFSAKISSSMGNEVLISSPECGILTTNAASGQLTADLISNVYNPWISERTTSYANYAQRCYSDVSSAGDCLAPFIKKSLSTVVNRNASCPFKNRICTNVNNNIRIDTGYINSQTDLGFNSPLDSQYNLRTITHCAPLKAKEYQQMADYSGDKRYTQYFYGPRLHRSNHNSSFFTYEMPQQSSEELAWINDDTPAAEYQVDALPALVYNGSLSFIWSDFDPVEDLKQTTSDIALFFLSANGIQYSQPVDDAWYSAHQRGWKDEWYDFEGQQFRFYFADEAAPALGCKMQYQICDPALPSEQGCSSWGGLSDVDFSVTTPKSRREKILQWGLTPGISIYDLVSNLQQSSLTSRYRLTEGFQAALPVDQWQTEVENWVNISLASLQGMLLDFATGPGDSAVLKNLWQKPSKEEEKYFCQNQKIISTAYTNFSMMWLIIVLAVGVLIIVFEQTLESIVVWLERRGTIKITSAEWFNNDTFQLSRMVHEELGLGNWTDCTGPRGIPTTEKGQLLGVLDCTDPNHPRLVDPAILSNKVNNDGKLDHSDDQDGRIEGTQTDRSESPTNSSQNCIQYEALCNSSDAGKSDTSGESTLGGDNTVTENHAITGENAISEDDVVTEDNAIIQDNGQFDNNGRT